MDKRKIAVVTGAAGGFGREFVKLMLEEDVDEIWAIGRNEEKLQALATEFGAKIKPMKTDLSQKESFCLLESALDASCEVKYVINNAGYGKFCAWDELGWEASLSMTDVNINAVVAVGLICLPHMEKGGAIINIASQASFFPLPFMNIYAASKAFVRNYTRALNVELKEKGISATAVCPGWMKTGFFDCAQMGAKKSVNNFFGIVTPEAVARKALKDAKNGKDISVYGAFVKLTHFLSKLAPQKTAMKIWMKLQKFNA